MMNQRSPEHEIVTADQEKDLHQHDELSHPTETLEEKPRHGVNNQLDDAARLLQAAGGVVHYTPEDSRRVLRRIDLFVCVPMCLTYFVQQVRTTSVQPWLS